MNGFLAALPTTRFHIKNIITTLSFQVFKFKIKRVYGPKAIKYGLNEFIVTCVVKNGESYIRSFVDHYFSLGAKHIVFLDNNSTDNTVPIACEYKNVTVLKCGLSDVRYFYEFKRYLIKRFCRGRWCLWADIDEFFDYPFSDAISMNLFLKYLNQNNYTAVVVQMLDMFSDEIRDQSKIDNDENIKKFYPYYDISCIEKLDYCFSKKYAKNNIPSNREIKFYRGGIRKTLFNVSNYLTKHPLVLMNRRIKLVASTLGSHFVNNAHCADVTCVFYHYVFEDLHNKSMRYLKERWGWLPQYENYVDAFMKNPRLNPRQETSKELKNVNDLVKNGFLVVSENYLEYIRSEINKISEKVS